MNMVKSIYCAVVLACALTAQAQEAATPTFVIKGFDIVGENPLSSGDVSRILAPYLRTDATIETLQRATQALEAALKDRGYVLHRVALPPQEVGATVKLNIVKFVIGKVTIEGRNQFTEANVRASLPELAEGSAPNFQTLAVQTAIANESQGKQVQVSLKESEEPDKIDARILLRESKPWYANVNLSNTGSQATGNDRMTFAAGHANVADMDHALTLALTTSIERPDNVKQYGLNYKIPMYRWGGVFAANLTQSDVVGDFGSFKSTGAGQTTGLSYSHYLAPQGGFRSYVSLGLDDKQFNITKINGVPLSGQVMRRSMPLTLGYTARLEGDTAVWGYNAELAANVPAGAGNDLAAYRTEDTRISTAQWTALRGGASYSAPWQRGLVWGVRGQFQLSPDALIAGEQFGIGGATSVRGTGERPIAADNGLALTAELTGPEWLPGLRGLGFVDAGWLGNNTPNVNKPASDSVASLGFGLRYLVQGLSISADYGRVVAGSSLPTSMGSTIPRAGDDKAHINITAKF